MRMIPRAPLMTQKLAIQNHWMMIKHIIFQVQINSECKPCTCERPNCLPAVCVWHFDTREPIPNLMLCCVYL